MHCIILHPGAAGRLPTAEELRQRGFAVSEAVAGPDRAESCPLALAFAAEAPADYGHRTTEP